MQQIKACTRLPIFRLFLLFCYFHSGAFWFGSPDSWTCRLRIVCGTWPLSADGDCGVFAQSAQAFSRIGISASQHFLCGYNGGGSLLIAQLSAALLYSPALCPLTHTQAGFIPAWMPRRGPRGVTECTATESWLIYTTHQTTVSALG